MPEELETFILELSSPTNNSILGSPSTTTLYIVKNDVAVFFKGLMQLFIVIII